MKRRTVLAVGGLTLAGLAGCLGRSDDTGTPTDDTGTPTDDNPTTTTQTYDGVEVSLEAVQPGVVELISPDSVGVHDTDRQFVSVQVDTAGVAPPRDAFALQFDGVAYPPADLDDYRLYREYGDSTGYTDDRGSGWLLFELPPTGDASAAAVTWPGGRFTLPETARRQLSTSAPSLSVAFSGPDTAAVGDAPPLSVEVTNESDVPGQFVAGLNRTGPLVAYIPVTALSVLVPAGETVPVTPETDALDDPGGAALGDDEPDVTYTLAWAGGDAEVAIPMVD